MSEDLRNVARDLEAAFLALESEEHVNDLVEAARLSDALVAVKLRTNERIQALEIAQARARDHFGRGAESGAVAIGSGPAESEFETCRTAGADTNA